MARPVEVRKASFRFCRVSLTVILWIAVILKSPTLLACVFILLAASAALEVDRAPMVVLGDRLFPGGETVVLDVSGMRFAHGLGASLTLGCLALVWGGWRHGWAAAAALAAVKTVNMFGFCPAERAYRCVAEGGCCSFLKKRA